MSALLRIDGRKLLVRLLFALALGVALWTALSATKASADYLYGIPANGCTAVPDSGYGYNFHDICDIHDYGYGTHRDVSAYGIYYGGYGISRYNLDNAFHVRMDNNCYYRRAYAGSGFFASSNCYYRSDLYYQGVRYFGYPFYSRYSVNTPMG